MLDAVPLPGNVLVYPTAPESSLKYDISTIGNKVIVHVKQVTNDTDLPNDTPGDGAIALDPTGAIYIY